MGTCLSPAVPGLPESGEFFLELAAALQPLREGLSPADQKTIAASFAAVRFAAEASRKTADRFPSFRDQSLRSQSKSSVL